MFGPRNAYFLIDGLVSQSVRPNQTRLWREPMLFEDAMSDDERPVFHSPYGVTLPTYGVALTRCSYIEIPNIRLRALAKVEPEVGMLIARMATARHALTDRLYASGHDAPTVRVAALLDYLTRHQRKTLLTTREEDGVQVMTTIDELVAEGPRQSDIAEALCLGRATVEKALSELRRVGALRAFGRGERTNRCYPVKDRDLLRQAARGG
jgi:CRP-like cAMP-binding protein